MTTRTATLRLLAVALVATGCRSERSSRTEWSSAIAPDSIDSLIARKQVSDSVFARIDSRLVYVPDSTHPPANADAIIRISRTPTGQPLRYVEAPVSESGDWTLALIHYFDADGRTQQFVSMGSYFAADCGHDIVVDRRVIRYRSDFTVMSSTRTLRDNHGAPVDSLTCRGDYAVSAGHPYPSFEAIREHGLAR